jgi:hypothetical protein
MTTPTDKSQYLVLCRGIAWDKGVAPEEIQNAMNQFYTWFERLVKEGKLSGAHRLAPEGKVIAGRTASVDGPFAESKEAIGGIWFIHANSLEEAVEIAKGDPTLKYGHTVEIRPVLPEIPEFEMTRRQLRENAIVG